VRHRVQQAFGVLGTIRRCNEIGNYSAMYKLIVIFVALIPIILLLRTMLAGRPKKASRAFSEFKKQIDLLVWVILFIIGVVIVYSIGELIHSLWR
jgi:hypothetical protein